MFKNKIIQLILKKWSNLSLAFKWKVAFPVFGKTKVNKHANAVLIFIQDQQKTAAQTLQANSSHKF